MPSQGVHLLIFADIINLEASSIFYTNEEGGGEGGMREKRRT